MSPFPMLVVKNLKQATRWYRKILGFRLVLELPGPTGGPILALLRWPGDGDLVLVGDGKTAPTQNADGPSFSLTFSVGRENVDRIAVSAAKNGANIVVGPIDQPWNKREVTLRDPDGYHLTFVEG